MRGFAGFFDSPFPSGDGPLAIAFDGTIHNRAELAGDAVFADDAGLVLALYTQHGAACVERLRGPFTLAIWDTRDGGTGLLARDAMGLRSLYYFHDARTGRLTFATGVKALLADGTVPRQLDARGLYGFFRHGAVPEPSSMVAGVHALETGSRLLWRAGQLTIERPPTPQPIAFPPDDRDGIKNPARGVARQRGPTPCRLPGGGCVRGRRAGFGGAAGVGARGGPGKKSSCPDDWFR